MIRWLPLWFFLAAYFLLNVAGAVILIWRIEPFFGEFEQFAGVTMPVLSEGQRRVLLDVLLGSPLALALGYAIVICSASKFLPPIRLRFDVDSELLTRAVFCLLFGVAAWSLIRAGAFASLQTWGNYDAWVQARWQLFATLSFFEYVNIYSWLPASAAVAALASRSTLWRWLPLPLVLSVDLLIYQKKPALFTLLTYLGALWLRSFLIAPSASRKYMAMGASASALGVLVYVALVLFPQFIASSHEGHGDLKKELAAQLGFDAAPPVPLEVLADKSSKLEAQQSEGSARADADGKTEAGSEDGERHAAPVEIPRLRYAILSLIMRTAAPAVFYAVIFPDRHPYFPLDLGRPFRKGPIPNDPAIVWHAMYPNLAGSATAPFNFVFYSQGGVAVASMFSALLGGAIALCWHLIVTGTGGMNVRCCAGITLVGFCIHLTVDSLRHSVIVSYGYAWVAALILVLIGCSWLNARSRPVAAVSGSTAEPRPADPASPWRSL